MHLWGLLAAWVCEVNEGSPAAAGRLGWDELIKTPLCLYFISSIPQKKKKEVKQERLKKTKLFMLAYWLHGQPVALSWDVGHGGSWQSSCLIIRRLGM